MTPEIPGLGLLSLTHCVILGKSHNLSVHGSLVWKNKDN